MLMSAHSHGNQQVDEHNQHQHGIDSHHEHSQAAGHCVDRQDGPEGAELHITKHDGEQLQDGVLQTDITVARQHM